MPAVRGTLSMDPPQGTPRSAAPKLRSPDQLARERARSARRRAEATPQQREKERQRSLRRRQEMTDEERKLESRKRNERRNRARSSELRAAAPARGAAEVHRPAPTASVASHAPPPLDPSAVARGGDADPASPTSRHHHGDVARGRKRKTAEQREAERVRSMARRAKMTPEERKRANDARQQRRTRAKVGPNTVE